MRNMAQCACDGGEGSCSGVLWRNTRRARGTFPLRAQTPRTRKNSSTAVQPLHKASLGGSGSPLSALLICLAAVVDRSGRSSAEHNYIVCTVKRYFSGVAHRLWHKRR